jgi:hypothetical protein
MAHHGDEDIVVRRAHPAILARRPGGFAAAKHFSRLLAHGPAGKFTRNVGIC